jgi:hypothetical protein
MPAQLQGIALKLPAISAPWVCKLNLELTQEPAGKAKYPLDGDDDVDRLGTDGNAAEFSFNSALSDHMTGSAATTAPQFFSFENPKGYFPMRIDGVEILVATNTESMIQETGGHDGFPPLMFLSTTMKET